MDRTIHPGIATEIDRLDEAVDKARAAFESASEIDELARVIGERGKVEPKVAMHAAIAAIAVQLGAARVVLNSARLRLAGRLVAPRLAVARSPVIAAVVVSERSTDGLKAVSARSENL